MDAYKFSIVLVRLQGWLMLFYAFYAAVSPTSHFLLLVGSDAYTPNYVNVFIPDIVRVLMNLCAAIVLLKYSRSIAAALSRDLNNNKSQ